jgi:hypothetical protein
MVVKRPINDQDRKAYRSDRYQEFFNEISFDMSSGKALQWDETKSLYSNNNEQISLINEQAINRIIEVVTPKLTAIQLTCFNYLKEGYTQTEISELMGYSKYSNSTVIKIIQGNIDYQKSYKRRYGGLNYKIKTLCLQDEKFRQYVSNLYDLGGGAMLRLCCTWFEKVEDFFLWLSTPLTPLGLPQEDEDYIISVLTTAPKTTRGMNSVSSHMRERLNLTDFSLKELNNVFQYHRKFIENERKKLK